MKTIAVRAWLALAVGVAGGAFVATQAPQNPQDPNASADFLKRPPVLRQAPEAEQQMFLMQSVMAPMSPNTDERRRGQRSLGDPDHPDLRAAEEIAANRPSAD